MYNGQRSSGRFVAPTPTPNLCAPHSLAIRPPRPSHPSALSSADKCHSLLWVRGIAPRPRAVRSSSSSAERGMPTQCRVPVQMWHGHSRCCAIRRGGQSHRAAAESTQSTARGAGTSLRLSRSAVSSQDAAKRDKSAGEWEREERSSSFAALTDSDSPSRNTICPCTRASTCPRKQTDERVHANEAPGRPRGRQHSWPSCSQAHGRANRALAPDLLEVGEQPSQRFDGLLNGESEISVAAQRSASWAPKCTRSWIARASVHPYTQTHTRARTHARTHTRTHTHTHTANTHTHTHT